MDNCKKFFKPVFQDMHSTLQTRWLSPLMSPILLALLVMPGVADPSMIRDMRSLSFYHTHTGQSLQVTYFTDGEYSEPALVEVRTLLSDWRNGAETDIDPTLLDILWEVQQAAGHHDTFEIISAYRSPETNEMLRASSSGVAQGSQHLLGTAIDVRLRGFDTAKLRDTAIELQRGGVGYYAESDFVHIDTGRVRTW